MENYNLCHKPGRCCPELLKFSNGLFQIVDNNKQWGTHYMSEAELKQFAFRLVQIILNENIEVGNDGTQKENK